MPEQVIIKVLGTPQPQGSTRSFAKGDRIVTTSATPNLHSWRDSVAWAVKDAMRGRPPFTGPVVVSATFRFNRPKSVSVKKRPHHTVKPDLDKLERALLDALVDGGCIVDDAQVNEFGSVVKKYVDTPKPGGYCDEDSTAGLTAVVMER